MKFIHIADVHLGATPDLGFAWSESRAKEIWTSLSEVIKKVKEEHIELLLVAGDLFHGQPLMRECRELNFMLEQIPDTAVVLIAGNHDYIKKDSAYLRFPWAKNVVGLWGEKCQSCYIRTCNTYVYGFSYHGRERKEPVYNELFPYGTVNLKMERPNAHHILLAHGGDEEHIPIRFSALAQTAFDYIALGHIHQPKILVPGKMAYAGSLEPLDKNHIGQRGYIQGEITEEGTKITFIPFSKREYRKIQISLSEDSSNGWIKKTIADMIRNQGREHIYRIEVCGYRNPEWHIQTDELYELGNLIEITDKSVPEYDYGILRKKYAGTAVTAYIDSFGELSELSLVEKKALSYGVRALLAAERRGR